ncbi:MAG: histidine phosphatase family protein [Oceanospirillaceae bacterium]|nr:histidine phosphatase family protein [Oceanospirillaceae bacterium]
MKISLLRHGKTTSDDIYRGHTDVALTDKGLEQMHQSVATFKLPVDYLVSSDLQRCAIFSALLGPEMKLEKRFKEMSFGDWDGQSRAKIWREQPKLVSQFWDNPMHSCAPNGETVLQLQTRAMEALHEHVQGAIKLNCEHMLIVTHGGVIRAMLGSILHMNAKGLFNFNLPYAALVPLHLASFEDQDGQPDYHISLDFGAHENV